MAASTGGAIATNIGTASRPDSSIVANNNRRYKVLIDVRGEEAATLGAGPNGSRIFPMEANLPERFHMEMSAQWGMPFAQASLPEAIAGNGIGGAVLNAGAAAAGVGTKAKSQFVQAWDQTSPLQFSLDLIFYAQESTEREIKQRQLALLKLVAPSSKGEMLIAPGPRLLGEGLLNVEGRQIDIYIGSYLKLQNVIITNVGTDVVTLMDNNGIPIAMTINLGFQTWNACVTTEDLDAMFYGGA